MKKNEIIELNGIEYTLELNRDSFIQIDRLCNIDKSVKIIFSDLYDFVDEKELEEMALFSYRLALEVFHYYLFI